MTLLAATDIAVFDGSARLVAPVSLTLEPGAPLVVLGETGSGKSLLAQALMGTLPAPLRASGAVQIAGRSLRAGDGRAFRGLWGRHIAVLPQEPWLSLDPLMRSGAQVAEAHRLVRGLDPRAAAERAAGDLAGFGLAGAARLWPHELSAAWRSGWRSRRRGRAAPPSSSADEPTKGLDAARRDDVAALLLGALAEGGGLLVITHDSRSPAGSGGG